jgi:hypothetical protein
MAFCAVILRGGQKVEPGSFGADLFHASSDQLPDVMLFLDAGKVFFKRSDAYHVPPTRQAGRIDYYDAGENALLIFTALVLDVLNERSAHVGAPFFFDRYCSLVFDNTPGVPFFFAPALEGQPEAYFAKDRLPTSTQAIVNDSDDAE